MQIQISNVTVVQLKMPQKAFYAICYCLLKVLCFTFLLPHPLCDVLSNIHAVNCITVHNM